MCQYVLKCCRICSKCKKNSIVNSMSSPESMSYGSRTGGRGSDGSIWAKLGSSEGGGRAEGRAEGRGGGNPR